MQNLVTLQACISLRAVVTSHFRFANNLGCAHWIAWQYIAFENKAVYSCFTPNNKGSLVWISFTYLCGIRYQIYTKERTRYFSKSTDYRQVNTCWSKTKYKHSIAEVPLIFVDLTVPAADIREAAEMRQLTDAWSTWIYRTHISQSAI